MNSLQLRHSAVLASIMMLAVLLSAAPLAQEVGTVVNAGEKRNDAAKASQARVDKTAGQTDDLVGDYRNLLKVIDGLKVYNTLLKRQVDNQVIEVATLEKSIDDVSIIERQVLPLMVKMVDSLDQFIELDTPFHMGERRKRVANLKELLGDSGVTAAEKFRSVLEAYEIENNFGRTIDAYKGSLEVDGKSRSVDFLRIGRVALLYQTEGGSLSGVWNGAERTWSPLPSDTFKSYINKGLQVARKQTAPELLMLPISAPEGAL